MIIALNRRFDIRMTKQGCNHRHRHPLFQQHCSKKMSQTMQPEMFNLTPGGEFFKTVANYTSTPQTKQEFSPFRSAGPSKSPVLFWEK